MLLAAWLVPSTHSGFRSKPTLAPFCKAWETPPPQRHAFGTPTPQRLPKQVGAVRNVSIHTGAAMGLFDHLSHLGVSITRPGRGIFVLYHPAAPPVRPLQLFESEVCPFSRKVREFLSEFDIDYISYPTARGSQHREKLKELGGKKLFPFLLDPNTGRRIYESEEIITYLCEQYGRGRGLFSHLRAPFQTINALISSSLRQKGASVERGIEQRPLPREMLVLYQYEGSPSCRMIREVLHSLDLPCWIKNVAHGSMRRAELLRVSGEVDIPYFIDTNTATTLSDPQAIVRYLLATYGPHASSSRSAV